MKIRFLSDTHIRISPNVSADPIGVILKGAEIEVSPQVVLGQEIRDNDIWYLDSGGNWYYWSGKTEKVEHPPEPNPEDSTQPPTAPAPWANRIDYPVFDEMTSMIEEIEVPHDETRRVPSFETLEMIEAGFQNAIARQSEALSRSSQPTGEGGGGQEGLELLPASPVSGEQKTEPEASSARKSNAEENRGDIQGGLDQASLSGSFLDRPPRVDQLNWATSKYSIEQDWWRAEKLTGKGVKIALLSTGAQPGHPDLQHVKDWWLFEGATQTDEHGLGNQAAVICAGSGHSVYGIAPEAELLIVKIGAQDHLIRPEVAVSGMEWAMEAGADIIGILVDFPSIDSEASKIKALIEQAREKDIFLLAPVGNSESNSPELRYPAGFDGVFSVGAHNKKGEPCRFSARSYQLDILAPGQGLLTSNPNQENAMNINSVAIATAFAAGFAALISQRLKESSLSGRAAFIEKILKQTATSRQNLNMVKNVKYGYGLLNPPAVLQKLQASASE